jgi:hypothetical protein
MSSKSEKLVQRIQDVQKFVTAKANRASTLVTVAEELGRLVETLQSSKLKVQIASQYPVLAQALDKLVNTQTSLTARYQFDIASLPAPSPSTALESPASLLLKIHSRATSTVNKTRYPLPTDRKIIIGRNADCQIQVPIECAEVSRNHAEVRPFLNSSSHQTNFGWMVCDLNSANGTYVNDILLEKGARRILQAGDRIVLGKPNTAIADPEFIFELRDPTAVSQVDKPQPLLTHCDLLCLVFNPAQPISTGEKQLIERAHQARLLKILIVVNGSATNLNTPAIASNIAELQAWLNSQKYSELVEISSLDLQLFFPTNQIPSIAPNLQYQFVQSLEQLADSCNEDIVKEKIKKRFVAQLAIIEGIFNEQIQLAGDRIKEHQQSLGDRSIEEVNEQIKKALKQISEDKEKTFQQVKFQFNQSKSSLVDPFDKHSLPYKLQQFTDELKPLITKQQGENFLRLQSDKIPGNESINNYITRLCNQEIYKWSEGEWERICQQYQNGGLKAFYQRSHATLNFLPQVKLPAELFQPAAKFDPSKWLQASIVEFNKTHIAYQDPSKKGDALVAAGAGAVAVAFGNPIPLIMAGIGIFSRNVVQKQALDNRQEQQTEALKKGIYSHYQSLAKSMTEKLAQGFVSAFQTEDRRVKESVEKSVEEINAHLLAAKKGIEASKAQQNSLNQEKAELLAILKKP